MPLSPVVIGLATSVIVAVSSVAGPVAAATGDTVPATTTETTLETLVYKSVDGQELTLQVHRPDDSDTGPKPAIVLYHGGSSWAGGSLNQFQPQAEYLASRGMIGIIVEHRTQGPVIATEDAIDAFNYVAERTADLGIDPQRLAAGGGSSGGHLALSTALLDLPNTDDALRPAALVLMNPLSDTSGRDEFASEEQALTYSPFHHIASGAPPMLLTHGTGDTRIDYGDSAKFTDAMLAGGNSAEVISFDGQPHGFFNPDADTDDRYFNETTWAMDVFLGSLGFLAGPPIIRAEYDELAANGGVESGLAGWSGTTGTPPSLVSDPVHQGQSAMSIDLGNAAQDMTEVLAGHGPGEYLLGAWLAGSGEEARAATVSLEVKGTGDDHSTGFPLPATVIQPGDYAHVSGTRIVSWSGELESAELVIGTETASGGVYADDASVAFIPA